jgi:hypothetical protein
VDVRDAIAALGKGALPIDCRQPWREIVDHLAAHLASPEYDLRHVD